MRNLRLPVLFVVVFGVISPAVAVRGKHVVTLSEDELKKLDTFEGHTLAKADMSFGGGKWRQAVAEYDSFIVEFSKSKAVPYALVKKGRALQQDGKRFKAIVEYTEVLDYFPNVTGYAAPALYFTGECHWKNGDIGKAMKAWAKMADDKDYSRHFLAAPAIAKLAENLKNQEKFAEAAKYFEQVAIDFRRSNQKVALHAIGPVVEYHVRRSPSEPKLRKFYKDVGAFAHRPIKVPKDHMKDRGYWQMVRDKIRHYSTGKWAFTELQKNAKTRYFKHWAGVFKGKFPSWDDFQLDFASFQYQADEDQDKWIAHVDKQFEKKQTASDYGRIVRWIREYKEYKNKVDEYYKKLNFAKMKNGDIFNLLMIFFDEIGDEGLAKNLFTKLRLAEIPDNRKDEMVGHLSYRQCHGLVRDMCMTYQDSDRGKFRLLKHYHRHRISKEGLPIADELTKVAKYAASSWWMKAEFLQWTRKYEQAINAYRMCTNEPDNLWRVADCFVSLKKASSALQQLSEVESFFPKHKSQAALRIAYVYRHFKEKKKYVSSLRNIMKKYPKSSESRTAHVYLEKMGYKSGGSIDAE